MEIPFLPDDAVASFDSEPPVRSTLEFFVGYSLKKYLYRDSIYLIRFPRDPPDGLWRGYIGFVRR